MSEYYVNDFGKSPQWVEGDGVLDAVRYWAERGDADAVRDANFIVELVHYIGELQTEIIEKVASIDFYRAMDEGGFVDWESWSWYGDEKGDEDD